MNAPLTKPRRRCSVLKLDLPDDVAGPIVAYAHTLPPDCLDGEGVEPRPHVTVKFGLRTDDAAEVAEVIRGFGPVTLTLGMVGWMAVRAGGNGRPIRDVLYVEVVSLPLMELNWLVSERLACIGDTGESNGYTPHVTLARVKVGRARGLFGDLRFLNRQVTCAVATFSDRGRVKTGIEL